MCTFVRHCTNILHPSYRLQLDNKLGPLSTDNPDGAGHFHKSLGQLLSKDLPVNIQVIFASLQLFNKVGRAKGMTIACDLDHLGKRLRARIKTDMGIMIGIYTMTKVDLVYLLGQCQILTDPREAECLFNPEDLMDVANMIKCLDYIGKLSNVHWHAFPHAWRSVSGNRTKYKEIKVLGHVTRLMCALIIRHDSGAMEDSNHLSVSGHFE